MVPRMSDEHTPGLRTRLTKQGEEAVGKLAQELLENPVISGALSRAFEVREKASQAQEVAMGALNLPSASDLERLTRRVRSVSQRLEGIEDGLDRLDERLGSAAGAARIEERLSAIEDQLASLTAELHALRDTLPTGRRTVSRTQERLKVDS